MADLVSSTEEKAVRARAGARMLLPARMEYVRAINQVGNSNHWVCSEDLLLGGLHFLTHNSLQWKREKRVRNFRAVYILSQLRGSRQIKHCPFYSQPLMKDFWPFFFFFC